MAGSRRYQIEPQIKILEDGSVQNERIEAFALLLADGVHRATAWKLLGGKIEGGSAVYRGQIERDPLFQQRMKALTDEKELCMADDLYGEAKWMANQLWREARNTGNLTLAKQALDARMKILEREDARRGKEAPQEGVINQPGRPGKPVVENPQTHTGMEAIRQKLLDAGAPVPGSEPASHGKDAANPVEKRDAAPATVQIDANAEGVVFAPPVDFQAQLDRLLPG